MEAVVAVILKEVGMAVAEYVIIEGIKKCVEHYSGKDVQIASCLNTNLVLTVRDSSCQDSADVILQQNTKANNQIWTIRGSKLYPFCVEIVNKHSGLCLNFTGGISKGGHVGQYHASLQDPMNVFFIMPWKGFNLIVSPCLQKGPKAFVLDVPGANAHSGAKLQQWEFNNTEAQCFKITYL